MQKAIFFWNADVDANANADAEMPMPRFPNGLRNTINIVNREVQTKSERMMIKLFYLGREKQYVKRDQSINWS